MKLSLFASAALLCAALPAAAHEGDGGKVTYASDHAPIGVMADHRHKKGEWMASYRYMYMDMSGNRDGTDGISPEEIVTSVANPFANPPMMPPTLRVVPTDMPMQMHMLGGMYGLTDRITLMAMGMYVSKEMDHITFQGPMGTTSVLARSRPRRPGLVTQLLARLSGWMMASYEHRQINLGLAVSLPTGSIEETDQILTPMGTTPSPRLPYPMQLGSGTFDLKPSLTARSRTGKWSYGAQASAIIRLDENDEGYTLGDVAEATGWLAYEPQPWVSVSGRLKARVCWSDRWQ